MAAGGTVYLSYNVYRNDLSVLYQVLDKKKRLNSKERNTFIKLLYIKDQQKSLAVCADELFSYKLKIITEEERLAWEVTVLVLKFNWGGFLVESARGPLSGGLL